MQAKDVEIKLLKFELNFIFLLENGQEYHNYVSEKKIFCESTFSAGIFVLQKYSCMQVFYLSICIIFFVVPKSFL